MKKFLVIMLAMLWMSVAAFSQITISQEDYDKLPNETRTQIEKITTEKAIKGEIKEVSEYANLGKEIGVCWCVRCGKLHSDAPAKLKPEEQIIVK